MKSQIQEWNEAMRVNASLAKVNAEKRQAAAKGEAPEGERIEVPASFTAPTPEVEGEDDGETILRNGKVDIHALTHSGFGLMTRQGEVTIPLPSFGWWIRLNQFHRSQSAYQLSVQAVLQPDKAAELAPSVDYLRRISPLRWFPSDHSQVPVAIFYALVFPLRILSIKLQIKELQVKKQKWYWQKLTVRRKLKRLENLLAEVEDTENSLIDSPPDKGVVDWLDTIIDPATVSVESAQAIDTINAYFGKKKRVNLPVL